MGAPPGTGTARPSVVTIGNFDGVHVGHRRLIAEAMRDAETNGWRSVALTFDRHPAVVVRPQTAPLLLTDSEQKLALLRATGIDEVVVLGFDDARAAETAEDFVREVLVGELNARRVVVGSNFRFGNGQRGDVELLAKLGGDLGFSVSASELVADDADQAPVSSSRIRALITAGQIEHANRLLGHPHAVRVTVRAGRGEAAGAEAGAEAEAEAEAGVCLPREGAYRAVVAPAPMPVLARQPQSDSEQATVVVGAGRRLRSEAFSPAAPGDALLVCFLA